MLLILLSLLFSLGTILETKPIEEAIPNPLRLFRPSERKGLPSKDNG